MGNRNGAFGDTTFSGEPERGIDATSARAHDPPVSRPAAVLGTMAVFVFSLYTLAQHVRAGDAFEFAWGKTAAQKRTEARELADFKLSEVAKTLEGVKAHTGSYWVGDVIWNDELRIAWANDLSYCVELRDAHGVYHRRLPGPDVARDGPCAVV
jgi:hypothetical protein